MTNLPMPDATVRTSCNKEGKKLVEEGKMRVRGQEEWERANHVFALQRRSTVQTCATQQSSRSRTRQTCRGAFQKSERQILA